MIAIARFTRNYSTAFMTFAGREYDVPQEIFNKFPGHFIVQMTVKKPVEIIKPKIEQVETPVKKTKSKAKKA